MVLFGRAVVNANCQEPVATSNDNTHVCVTRRGGITRRNCRKASYYLFLPRWTGQETTGMPSEGQQAAAAEAEFRPSPSVLFRDVKPTKLKITVHEARDLIAKDSNGKSDPYVILSIGNETHKTRFIPKTLNPVWETEVVFDVHDPQTEVLEVSLWDHDYGFRDDFLGKATLRLAEILIKDSKDGEAGLSRQWYTLEKRSEASKVKGDICLSFQFIYPEGSQALKFSQAEKDRLQTFKEMNTANSHALPENLAGWVLYVHVIRGRDLPPMDADGLSDPYVEVKIRRQHAETAIQTDTLEPNWDQVLKFTLKEGVESKAFVKFKVWDFDRNLRNDLMGKIRVPLSQVRVLSEAEAAELLDKEKQTIVAISSPTAADTQGGAVASAPADDPENDPDARWLLLETAMNLNARETLRQTVSNVTKKLKKVPTAHLRGSILVSMKLLPPVQAVEVKEDNEEKDVEDPAPITIPDPLPNLLFDEVLPIGVNRLRHMIFGSESAFYEEFWKTREWKEVEIKPWCQVDGQKKRELCYIMPLTNPMGPKEAQCFQSETYTVWEDGGYVVDVYATTPHVPYGGCFHTILQFLVAHEKNGSARIRASLDVVFTKSTMMKSLIRSGTLDGVQATYRTFIELLRQKAGGAPPPSSGAVAERGLMSASNGQAAGGGTVKGSIIRVAGIEVPVLAVLLGLVILLLLWVMRLSRQVGTLETATHELLSKLHALPAAITQAASGTQRGGEEP
eukprot:jgi/Mesvir1/3366/Mv04260-RA.1